jgi:hypothetical protein
LAFTFPSIASVDPSVCSADAEYSCDYFGGPYSGALDLCGFTNTNGGFSSSGSFDDTTGGYVFSSSDVENFPPGDYLFDMKIKIGDQEVVVRLTLTLENVCADAALSTGTNPFAGPNVYVLNDPQGITQYSPSNMVTSTVSVNCG